LAIINVTNNFEFYAGTFESNVSVNTWNQGSAYPLAEKLFSSPAYLSVYGQFHVYDDINFFFSNNDITY